MSDWNVLLYRSSVWRERKIKYEVDIFLVLLHVQHYPNGPNALF